MRNLKPAASDPSTSHPRFSRDELLRALRDALSPKDRPVLDSVVRNYDRGMLRFDAEVSEFGSDAWILKARCVGIDNMGNVRAEDITKPNQMPKLAILKMLFT